MSYVTAGTETYGKGEANSSGRRCSLGPATSGGTMRCGAVQLSNVSLTMLLHAAAAAAVASVT
jgi:hypothetical protein